MELRKITVKGMDRTVQMAEPPGYDNGEGLPKLRRLAVRTRGGELVTVEIPGEYVRNARTVQGVAGADILSGETVYGEKGPDAVEFKEVSEDGGSTFSLKGGKALPTPDGRWVIYYNTNTVYFFRWVDGKPVYYSTLPGNVRVLDLSPEGKVLVVAEQENGSSSICVYSLEEEVTKAGTILAEEQNDPVGVFSPDGTVFLYTNFRVNHDTGIKIYTVSGASLTQAGEVAVSKVGFRIKDLKYSRDGGLVVAAVNDYYGSVHWFTAAGTDIAYGGQLEYGTDGVIQYPYRVGFSPDGSTLLVGDGEEHAVAVYSVDGTTVTRTPDRDIPMTGGVEDIAFSPDGKALVIAGRFPGGAKLYVVEGDAFRHVRTLFGDEGNRGVASFFPDGERLYVSSGRDMVLYLVRGIALAGPGENILHPAADGKIPGGNWQVGFAVGAIAAGETGTARIIGEVEP